MFLGLRLPKTLLWVINLVLLYTGLFTLLRCLTLFLFKPDDTSATQLLSSFLLGLRYDLRWISLLLFPIVLLSSVPSFSPYYSHRSRTWWTWYLALTTFFVVLLYAIDFGCFAYFKVRLGATVFNFADDAAIATVMLWEMYPLFWMLLALALLVVVLRWTFSRLHRKVASQNADRMVSHQNRAMIVAAALMLVAIYGGFPQPLRREAAFQLADDFGSYLALNPLQSVYSTLGNRTPQFDEDKARQVYPSLSKWMGWKATNGKYQREVVPTGTYFSTPPNVVLVMCESFSFYKTSLSGNVLNATPAVKTLCDSGLYFSRCFTPHFSTARGLFATITGIPDVQLAKFSNRTDAATDQHTIINNFDGYKKFYFLGGSPAFNNFGGLMQNVGGINMMTEGSFRSRPIDVWGISDKNLFLEADKIFATQATPFFAVIQTSDNHPPYSIAQEDSDFVKANPDEATLEKAGFTSVAEYNALRYFDYSVRKFMEAARSHPYFQNTLFVFVGDHGVAGNATAVLPTVWTEQRLTEMHVPLLFYAPGHVPAARRDEVVSQIDVLPTLADLAGQRHVNTTLGRSLVRPQANAGAFFIRHDEAEVGMITDEFYFSKNLLLEKEKLLPLQPGNRHKQLELDSVQRRLSTVTSAYLETARWMLMNNKK